MTHTRAYLHAALLQLTALLLVCVVNPCLSLGDGSSSPTTGLLIEDAEPRETADDFDGDDGGVPIIEPIVSAHEWLVSDAPMPAKTAPKCGAIGLQPSRAPPGAPVALV